MTIQMRTLPYFVVHRDFWRSAIGHVYFLAFKVKLAYSSIINQVAKSLLGLPYMPARTLNDFFAGFFVSHKSRHGG